METPYNQSPPPAPTTPVPAALSPYAAPASSQHDGQLGGAGYGSLYPQNLKAIKRISPLSAATTCAVVIAILTLAVMIVAVPIIYIDEQHSPYRTGTGMLIMMALLAPIIYGILAFIGGALIAWIYNFTAKMTGGIKVTLEDKPY